MLFYTVWLTGWYENIKWQRLVKSIHYSVFGAAIEWVIVSDCGSHSCADWWVLQHWHRGCVRQDGNSFVRPSWKVQHPQCFILNGEHGIGLVIFYCLVHRNHLHTFGRFLRSPSPILQHRKLRQRRQKQISQYLEQISQYFQSANSKWPTHHRKCLSHSHLVHQETLLIHANVRRIFSRAQICCIKNEGWWQEQMRKEPLIWWKPQYQWKPYRDSKWPWPCTTAL